MTRKLPQKHKKSSLGPLLAEYRDRPLTWRDLVLTFTPAALAALAPLAYGNWRSWWGSLHYGPAVSQAWGMPWYLLSGLATLGLLLLAWLRLRRAGRWVRLHRAGLVIHTSSGLFKSLHWGEIRGVAYQAQQLVFLGRVYRTRIDLYLHLEQGRRLRLDPHLPGLPELGTRIKARVYPQQLPQLRQAFHAGQDIHFGPVTLHKDRLTIHNQLVSWNQLIHLDLRGGYLVVELQNQAALKIPAREIPNLELLLQLIQEGVTA
ncbi:MAG: hypothetical protein JW862_06955 [Anaerolineales bacterium]|nr:hypothetical protein [Anaerolineales bacterium]